MGLRFLVAVFCIVALWISSASAEDTTPAIEVWKSASCKCCGKWVKHLEDSGFAVTVDAAGPSMLDRIKREAGIGRKLASCHTAKIDGYVIEGQLPPIPAVPAE